MKKSKLSNFISKYNLGGNIESVIWNIEKDQFSTRYISDDNELLAEITMKNVTDTILVNGIELNGEVANLGIYDTKQLAAYLRVGPSDEFDITLLKADRGKHGSAYCSLTLIDTETKSEMNFMLTETSIIRDTPIPANLPNFDLELNLDKKFREDFIKAKNALPEALTFTIITTNETDRPVKLVIGYEDVNSNRITIYPKVQGDVKEIKNVAFNTVFLKEILTANSEVDAVILNVSQRGIAVLEYETEDFDAKYYLVTRQT